MESSENATATKPQPVPKQRVRFSPVPLLLDSVLRSVALALFLRNVYSTGWFWTLQLIVIPAVVMFHVGQRFERSDKIFGRDAVEVQSTRFSVALSIVCFVSGVVIFWSLSSHWSVSYRIGATILLVFVYGGYIVGLHETGITDRLVSVSSPTAIKPLQLPEAHDLNDMRIVEMETEVQSISQRVEGYTLESTLLGGLSFSGFLALLASEKPIIQALNHVGAIIDQTFEAFPRSDVSQTLATARTAPFTADDLLAIVTVLTLLSSLFFLAVIISRLRYYEVLQRVEYAVRKARVWNDKEEEVFLIVAQQDNVELRARLDQLTASVTEAVDHAEPLRQDLLGIARYLWLLRNLGLGCFLVSSC
jgi:hypothetical protein